MLGKGVCVGRPPCPSIGRCDQVLGVLLLRAAEERRMNVMVETSGRDIGMFEYVEHLFPSDSYRKLVLNFRINTLSFAGPPSSCRRPTPLCAPTAPQPVPRPRPPPPPMFCRAVGGRADAEGDGGWLGGARRRAGGPGARKRGRPLRLGRPCGRTGGLSPRVGERGRRRRRRRWRVLAQGFLRDRCRRRRALDVPPGGGRLEALRVCAAARRDAVP